MGLFSNKQKWYDESIYRNPQYFRNISKSIDRRQGRGTYSIKKLLEMIKPEKGILAQCMQLSDDIPRDLIPYGRGGTTIDRDFTFYQYAQEYMNQNESENTLYINYTGHPGPVASVLAKHNIPTYWQMDLSTDNIAEQRILEQIQDYIHDIANNTQHNSSNIGLLLEPPHGFDDTIIDSVFPSPDMLKKQGIKKVIIFTEDSYIAGKRDSSEQISRIAKHIETLEKSGLKVEFVRNWLQKSRKFI